MTKAARNRFLGAVALRQILAAGALCITACAGSMGSPGAEAPAADAGSRDTRVNAADAEKGGSRVDTAAPPTGAADTRTSIPSDDVAPPTGSGPADANAIADSALSVPGADAGPSGEGVTGKHVIIDTDADNEVDDQHAIAYVIMNSDLWTVDGVTTNHTWRESRPNNTIANDVDEAERVVKMLGAQDKIKVYRGVGGANRGAQVDDSVSYAALKSTLDKPSYEGKAAVDFIVDRARRHSTDNKLVLLPIGKLTNIALALAKDPSIVSKVRVLWLGSDWPVDTDEHNERHDRSAVNALMDSQVEFEIATVRYESSTVAGGTAVLIAKKNDIDRNMPGAGPQVSPKVPGRDGLGEFSCFGDYSAKLFPHDRPLFDVAAVALEKTGAGHAP